ncbi:hypothetical protein KCU88_g188, partial [Aureobasidium melanogenum]
MLCIPALGVYNPRSDEYTAVECTLFSSGCAISDGILRNPNRVPYRPASERTSKRRWRLLQWFVFGKRWWWWWYSRELIHAQRGMGQE